MQFLKHFHKPLVWLSFLYHLLLLGTPFVFTWVNEELFEFPKMLFVYALTILIGAAWVWRMQNKRQWLVSKTVLDIPILLFLLSQILATIFSIHPHTSLFGYYTRFNGGLLSTIAYIVLFYGFVSNFSKKDIAAFVQTALVGAFLSSLYAIPEHYGHSASCLLITGQFDVNCWVQDVQTRVFASFGQPNWLAAYLITLLPLTLVRFTTKTRQWLLWGLALLMTMALLFTKSRSGFVGLAIGLGLMAGVQLVWRAVDSRMDGRIASRSNWLSLGLVGLVVLIIGSPFTPALSQLWQKPTAAPVTEVSSGTVLDNGGTDSGVIRKIVWEGAIKVWQRYPLFGSGVETFAYSYYQDRPVAHNTVSEWDFLYNKAHNEFLNYFATTGLVGGLSYIALLVWFGIWCLIMTFSAKRAVEERQLALALLAGVVALSISNFFGFSTVMVNVLMFWFMSIAALLAQSEPSISPTAQPLSSNNTIQFDLGRMLGLSVVGLIALMMLYQTYQQWWADRLFVKAKQLYQSGQYELALDHFAAAISARPTEALYYDELAMDYGKLAVELDESGQATAATQLAETAIKASDYALTLNPRHLNFYKTRARIYIGLAQINPSYLQKAIETLESAIKLSPTDAKLYYNLALVQSANNDLTNSLVTLQKTVELKPDYLTARFELGKQWEEAGELDKARAEYEHILTNLSPDNPEVSARLQKLATSSAQPAAR